LRGYTGDTFDPLGAAEAVSNHTIGLILHPERVSPQAHAIAFMKLAELQIMLNQKANLTGDDSQKAHYFFAISEIDRFRKDPSSFSFIEHLNPPPGAPIGMYH
jgi:hypothetical protein